MHRARWFLAGCTRALCGLRRCPGLTSNTRPCSTQAMSAATLPSSAALTAVLREQLLAQSNNTGGGTALPGISRRAIETQAWHAALQRTSSNSVTESTTSAFSAKAQLAEAWNALSTMHYMVADPSSTVNDTNDDLVHVCDWPRVMTTVAMTEMPYEGLRERDFVFRLRAHCPSLPECAGQTRTFSGATSLAAWVVRHFARHFILTRSAVTQEPIYYAAHCNNVDSLCDIQVGRCDATGRVVPLQAADNEALRALTQAMRLLGGGKSLPMWYDVSRVTALVSPTLCPQSQSWSDFLLQPHIQHGGIELRTEVQVRAAHAAGPTHYFILDATSLTPTNKEEEDGRKSSWDEMLRARGFVTDGSCALTVLHRGSQRPTLSNALQNDNNAVASSTTHVEYVVVDDILDAEHVCAALLAKLLPSATSSHLDKSGTASETGQTSVPSLQVTIVCADDKRDAFERMLHDMPPPQQASLHVMLSTPGQPA